MVVAIHAFQLLYLYNAAMAKSITVRDIPDETSERLASRAAATGRSLQEYLRARLIELAERPDADALVAAIRERKLTTHSQATVEQILGRLLLVRNVQPPRGRRSRVHQFHQHHLAALQVIAHGH